MRVEHDFLGEMELPDDIYYGIQTMRGVKASGVSGQTFGEDAPEFLRALVGLLKKAAALANMDIGALPIATAEAIASAADEVISGRWNDQFPVDLITGGGGVSPHMNMNEVLARRAAEISGHHSIHPNSHVNMGQSTNDVFPSAMLLTFYYLLTDVMDAVEEFAAVTERLARSSENIVKLGRTCLQDALPVTFGHYFSAWSAFLLRQIEILRPLSAECLILPLGGTAVGTGAGALPGFRAASFTRLRSLSGLDARPADNCFDSMQFGDLYIRISSALKALAAGLSKMASDLRLLSSGPRGGLNELVLPAVLLGSSIMPGKINPILPELIIQIYFLVCGNDIAVAMAVERGELELNVWEAVVFKCILDSCRLLSRSIRHFSGSCVAGIKLHAFECRQMAEKSTSLAAIISAVFGYETGCAIAKKAGESGKSIREIAVEEGLLDEQAAADLLDPLIMTDGERMDRAIANAREKYNKA